MGTYDWPDLLNRWERKELTMDQAIGQLLQWAQETGQTVPDCQRRVASLERQLKALIEQLEALRRQLEALADRQRRQDKSGRSSK